MTVKMDECEHGFPLCLCRLGCDGNDRCRPSELSDLVNHTADHEQTKVPEHSNLDTVAAAEGSSRKPPAMPARRSRPRCWKQSPRWNKTPQKLTMLTSGR